MLCKSLIDDQVWLAAPNTFNDPLDCKFQVTKQSTDEELLEHVNTCAEARHEARRFTVDDLVQIRTDIDDVLGKLSDGIRNTGTCCFVATPFEPSMWAHYADGHRGFCVEYERKPENDLGDDQGCARVEYTDRAFPNFSDLAFFRDPQEVVRQILLAKARSWEREKEWRLVRIWKTELTDRGYRLKAPMLSVTFWSEHAQT